MKLAKRGWLAILAEVLNCIIVQYALSNMALLLHTNPLFILLFAAKLWMWSSFWQRTGALCKNKVLSVVLTALCFVAEMCLLCFVGRAVGEIVPF